MSVIRVGEAPWRTLQTVVDAEAAKEPAKAFSVQMIAHPFAETIVKQFPDRFMAELK